MKKINIYLGVFLSLIIFLAFSSSALALQSGDFYYTLSGGTVTITKYAGPGGAVVIPAAIDGNSVTSIGTLAFDGCIKLTSVVIPDSVTSIGIDAFFNCPGLTSVTIPAGVISIGDMAFANCSNLSRAVFYGNAPSLGENVFYHCLGSFTVCYTAGATGFTTPIWHGYFAAVCEETTTTAIAGECRTVWTGVAWRWDDSGSTNVSGSIATFETSRTPQAAEELYSRVPYPTACYFNNNYPTPSFDNNCYGFTDLTVGLGHGYAEKWVCISGAWTVTCEARSDMGIGNGSDGYWNVICNSPITTTIFTTTTAPLSTTTTIPPTVIDLSSFTSTPKAGKVILDWSTESETDNAGFNIYRAEAENGPYTKINPALIPAQGSSAQGASYEFIDNDVQNRKIYYYKLEDIDLSGTSTMHGPVSATPRLLYGLKK